MGFGHRQVGCCGQGRGLTVRSAGKLGQNTVGAQAVQVGAADQHGPRAGGVAGHHQAKVAAECHALGVKCALRPAQGGGELGARDRHLQARCS